MLRFIIGSALLAVLLPAAGAQPAGAELGADTTKVRAALHPADPARVVQDGESHPMTVGAPLHDYADLPRPLIGTRRYFGVGAVPPGLRDTLTFAAVVSEAPDNTVLVLAGRTAPDAPWRVYLDRDNDNTFTEDEYLFTAETDDDNGGRPHKAVRASAVVRYDSLDGGHPVERDLVVEIMWVQNAPSVHSTSRHGGPLFLFDAHVALVEGALVVGDTSYAVALRSWPDGYYPPFRGYTEVLVDRDGDGQFDVSKGSAERYKPDETFPLGGTEWMLDNVDSGGRWARFRAASADSSPTPAASSRPGEPAPSWAGVTLSGDAIGSAELVGRYILLDFWASWCSPCVAELPYLRRVVERFGQIAVVGVATQDDEDSVRSAVAERDVTWPVVYDTGDEIGTAFRVVGLPDPVLVGPDGRVVERGDALRGTRLEETLLRYAVNE